MEMNEVLDRLPKHLMDLVIDQPYNEYTAEDHAVWRYVMRQNVRYLSKVAHGSYLNGLKATGISIDRIPHMYGMNRILKEIGWAAVAVDGFIPPSAFMEFQAYNVLVIAADIRPIDQIEYTPAPDIIHEAAGHAPIIADPEYAEYLRIFGEIGCRAFSSAKDHEIYEAIRHLSILKANPYTPAPAIEQAERTLDALEKESGLPSEMSEIRNLHWWTVEYGLIGDLKKPKIYGAGLLSSIGESHSSLQDDVKKMPYAVDAAKVNFDITTRQPQLFVTPDFEHLKNVLDQYAGTMALRKGGVDGILKAIESNNTATCVYSSGLQVSGTFSELIIHAEKPVYLKTDSPTTLNYKNKMLNGHSREHHSNGFGSPVGKLSGTDQPLEYMSDGELDTTGIRTGNQVTLAFESGVKVEGHLRDILRREGKMVLMTFTGCTVTFRDRLLFEPSWGVYDMAVGESIVSAFSGPADPDGFGLAFPVPKEKTIKIEHTDEARKLHRLYDKVREARENGARRDDVSALLQAVNEQFSDEWLLKLEILELLESAGEKFVAKNETSSLNGDATAGLKQSLVHLKERRKELTTLIENGFELIYGS